MDARPALCPATGDHARVDPVVVDVRDGQLDGPIPQHDAIAGLEVVDEVGVLDGDDLGVRRAVAGHEAQAVALSQERPAVRELAGPDLGPREVGQHRDRPAGDGRPLPDEGQPVQVVGHVTMAEVESEHVHAGVEQRVDLVGT